MAAAQPLSRITAATKSVTLCFVAREIYASGRSDPCPINVFFPVLPCDIHDCSGLCGVRKRATLLLEIYTVVPSYAQLSRDLLAIAKFLICNKNIKNKKSNSVTRIKR